MTRVRELAKMIDHSILQPTHTDEDLKNSAKWHGNTMLLRYVLNPMR